MAKAADNLAATNDAGIAVAIPTLNRGAVLLDTLHLLLALERQADEILVLDQTEHHPQAVEEALAAHDRLGDIRWIRLGVPSIPRAMNEALLRSRCGIVLFLDDDIVPSFDLIAAHLALHRRRHPEPIVVAGRVIQPWQVGQDYSGDTDFHFASTSARDVAEFMGGNVSMSRSAALACGGFDENFVRVAYNFEAEFAHRWRRLGQRIHFEPAAMIEHLKVGAGGTRSYGDHLTTYKPDHAVGAYYYRLRTFSGASDLGHFLARPLRSIATRHHLRRPWQIPLTLIAELSGMAWAIALAARGPRHVRSMDGAGSRIG